MIKNAILLIGYIVFFVVMALYGWSVIEKHSDIFKNTDWGIIFQLLIFWALPGLLTILGVLWLVGFLLKIGRKLDD